MFRSKLIALYVLIKFIPILFFNIFLYYVDRKSKYYNNLLFVILILVFNNNANFSIWVLSLPLTVTLKYFSSNDPSRYKTKPIP